MALPDVMMELSAWKIMERNPVNLGDSVQYWRWESNPHGRSLPEDLKSSWCATYVTLATRLNDIGNS
jgi:hypothetical protein